MKAGWGSGAEAITSDTHAQVQSLVYIGGKTGKQRICTDLPTDAVRARIPGQCMLCCE